jgi:putative ABC transport system substrate-binding protein
MRKLVVSRIVLALLLVGNELLLGSAWAADPTRPVRIGVLTDSWGPTPHIVGLRDGLLALDYREDADFVLGIRFTQGDAAALPTAADELVQYGVDLLFTVETNALQAAQKATRQIPIVFASADSPVEQGLIESFARPGGNITGVADLRLELNAKRLQLFHELVPGLKRILFPYDANDALSQVWATAYREAAHRLGMVVLERPMRTQKEAQEALAQVGPGQVDGILKPSALSLNIPGLILDMTTKQAIPTMFDSAFYVEHGGLASYGPDFYETGRQAARLVDKILKGANPAEIPVEVNHKIEFVINLKTAKVLGLTIAPEVLYQANRLIR